MLEDGLPIHHYAIFNNDINHNLIKIINDSGKPLTDELFFELLALEPAYLGTVLFQKRINEWRELCLWPELFQQPEQDQEKDKAKEKELENKVATAKSNLHKIGRVLARSGSGPGSPEQLPDSAIRHEYTKALKFLEEFFVNTGEKPSSKLLTKTYPEWSKAFQDKAGRHEHRSVKEIAIRLTLFRLATRDKNPLKMTLKTMRKIIQ
jgi:hypothetical protein